MGERLRITRAPRPLLDEEIVSSFRRLRVTDALAELCMERGYRATTMAHVAARARTSKRTLYKLFDSKEDAFLTLLRRVSEEIIELVDRHCAHPSDDRRDAIEIGLQTVLHWVQGNPSSAWVLLIEAPAGPANAMQVQLELFAAFSDRLRSAHPAGQELPESIQVMLVGGVATILRGVLLGGNADRTTAVFDGLMMHLGHPRAARP